MTKNEAIRNFNEIYAESVHLNPALATDLVAYRCGFIDYVDSLYSNGEITANQYDKWAVTIETVNGLKRKFSKFI